MTRIERQPEALTKQWNGLLHQAYEMRQTYLAELISSLEPVESESSREAVGLMRWFLDLGKQAGPSTVRVLPFTSAPADNQHAWGVVRTDEDGQIHSMARQIDPDYYSVSHLGIVGKDGVSVMFDLVGIMAEHLGVKMRRDGTNETEVWPVGGFSIAVVGEDGKMVLLPRKTALGNLQLIPPSFSTAHFDNLVKILEDGTDLSLLGKETLATVQALTGKDRPLLEEVQAAIKYVGNVFAGDLNKQTMLVAKGVVMLPNQAADAFSAKVGGQRVSVDLVPNLHFTGMISAHGVEAALAYRSMMSGMALVYQAVLNS